MKPGFYLYLTIIAFFFLSFAVRSRAHANTISDSEAAMQALFRQSSMLLVVNSNGENVSANYRYQSIHQNVDRPAVSLAGFFANVMRTLVNKSDILIENECTPRNANSEVNCTLSVTYAITHEDEKKGAPKQVLISYEAHIVDGIKDTKIVRLRPDVYMELRR